MALFDKKNGLSYDIVREGGETILKVDCENLTSVPSPEDNSSLMAYTIDRLIENKSVTKIVFSQKRDYEYDYAQTRLLMEIALLYNRLIKQKELFSYSSIQAKASSRMVNRIYNQIHHMVFDVLKKDPVTCFVELRRVLRHEKMVLDSERPADINAHKAYIELLTKLIDQIDSTRLITLAKPYLAGHKPFDREVYSKIFSPSIKPDFMYTKLMATYPKGGTQINSYTINDVEVAVFELEDNVQYLYHITPPEFRLNEEEYELLDLARNIIAEHKPTKQEFVDPARMREVFYNVGRDLLEELANYRNVKVSQKKLHELTMILIRYTVGFGLVEVLLADPKVQDVTFNSPSGKTPIYLVHQEHGDCKTNIMPSVSDAESWASKLRMISGRPLDEANPVLDTEISIPGIARARVGVIAPPLNPFGIAYAFRRHRDKPWTLPLFIHNKMISPLAAGLLSFLIDGNRTMLVAGTRSAGKTSLLGSVMVEIMRRYRILTIEDTLELPSEGLRDLGYNIQQMKVASALSKSSSEVPADEGIRTTLRLGDSALIVGEVRSSLKGDQEVIIVDNGLTKRIPIQALENENLKSFSLPTLDKEGKMKLKKLSGFVKHPKRKQLIKITTNSGREVIVTPDHSVFTHVNFKICAINTDQLKKGDPVIIPSKLPNNFNDINYINLLEIFKDDYRIENAEEYIRKAVKVLGWQKASKICNVPDIYRYLLATQKTRMPIKYFLKLMEKSKIKFDLEKLRIKKGTSNSIPAKFPINKNVMRFLGYYLAEGNINGGSIQITNSKPKIIEDIIDICKKEFSLKVSKRNIRGLGNSVQMRILSKPLSDLILHLGCGRTSFNKRVPEFIYGLNEKKICALLQGMYSGDGSISITKRASNMIRYFSTSKKLVEDVSYLLLSLGIVCRLHSRKSNVQNKKTIYIAEIKQRKYCEYFLQNIGFTHKSPELMIKSFSHSKDDSIRFDPGELERHLKIPRKYRHLRRTKCCSKDYLKRITEEVKCSEEIYDFAHGDFFIDRVKSIELIKLSKPEYVYDLEVNSTQRFIGGFGGILLHNTEARALYEAMRVGALANVVAGTIHGDSPYGVFDRVVNDLGVPTTSFKATDIVVVANPIRSPDGLHKWRRVTQITEVRKEWDEDPLREHAFVDLMKYDSGTDMLEPSDELINGDSDILKSIAGNVKEWAGDWDAVWENITLRANIKEELVKQAEKLNRLELLEAPFVIKCNDHFHKISDKIKEKTGRLDSERILFEWKEWLRTEIKKNHSAGQEEENNNNPSEQE